MLANYTPVAVAAVTDLARAREFYEGVLGLSEVNLHGDMPDTVLYASGTGHLLVYVSQFAGTNKATGFGFSVPSDVFDAEIADLRAKGVTFQTFDYEGITWDDGVATWAGDESFRAAWFADPDGNIINIDSGSMSLG